MNEPKNPFEYASRDSSRWLWLSALTATALVSLSNGKVLLAAGMLLMAVFAYFNNPLSPTPPTLPRPAPAIAISWACGVAGITLVIVAAARPWL